MSHRSVPAPTAAERARSVLAAAGSLTAVTPTYRAHLEGRHQARDDGSVALTLPAGAGLLAEADAEGGTSVVLEVTDVAPVAVRDRVRARLSLGGWLEGPGEPAGEEGSAGEVVVVLEPLAVALEHAGRTTEVDPEAYAAARPDPLALLEAGVLSHLDTDHGAELDALVATCAPGLDGGRRTRPLALDQYGLVLRVERAAGWCDVRVAFPRPVLDLHQAGHALRAMASAGSTRASRHRRP